MKQFSSCKEAIQHCLDNKTFAIAHLYHEEKTMNIHIHDCHEIYFSISGGRQFFIDNRRYEVEKGNLFVINCFESHHLTQVDESRHERIVLSICPQFLKDLSTPKTDLSACFHPRRTGDCHKVMMSATQQRRLMGLVQKIMKAEGFGADLTEQSAFAELMILINRCYMNTESEEASLLGTKQNEIVNLVIQYINTHITQRISLAQIANHCFISETYLCRLFKANTGTTVNKYLTARRVSIAKVKLSQGLSVLQTCEECGFSDYTSFVRAFSKTTGMTPRDYTKYANMI